MRIWISILVAAAVSYAIRVLPLTLIRRPLKSVFLRSFLYYVPYVTLAVMTFPAIVQATDRLEAGVAALAAVSAGTRTILLTVLIAGGAALLFPVKEEEASA